MSILTVSLHSLKKWNNQTHIQNISVIAELSLKKRQRMRI